MDVKEKLIGLMVEEVMADLRGLLREGKRAEVESVLAAHFDGFVEMAATVAERHISAVRKAAAKATAQLLDEVADLDDGDEDMGEPCDCRGCAAIDEAVFPPLQAILNGLFGSKSAAKITNKSVTKVTKPAGNFTRVVIVGGPAKPKKAVSAVKVDKPKAKAEDHPAEAPKTTTPAGAATKKVAAKKTKKPSGMVVMPKKAFDELLSTLLSNLCDRSDGKADLH